MADTLAPETSVGIETRQLTYADMEIRGDGRTLYGVLVPFNRETIIPGTGGRQREVFRPGSFRQSINVGVNRVKVFVNHNHLRGADPIGVATSLTEESRQLVGEFRIASTPDGDEALQKVRDGVFDAFSIGFMPGQQIRTKDVVERTEVKLREVSVVHWPAIEGASIMGIRAAFPEFTDDVITRMLTLAEGDTLERLLALAVSLDTPTIEAASGTSDEEQSTRTDEQQEHSSPETRDDEPSPQPSDYSKVARQRLRREIEMFHANIGKKP